MPRKGNQIFSQANEEETLPNNLPSVQKDLSWEVPVESVPLPSRGLIYNPNSYFYNKETIQIKAMTAREEDILLSQAYIKKGTVIDELIKSCIGNINADPAELTAGDKNALVVAIRITGYGDEYPIQIKCEKCGQVNNNIINLGELAIKRLGANPVEPGKNLFEFKLPVSGKNVLFKLLNGHDEEKRNSEIFAIANKLGVENVGSVTIHLMHSVVAIDNVTDRSLINKFVQNMPARDSKELRNYMSTIQPGINMEADFQCKNCGHATMVTIPWTKQFFYPD